MSVPAPAGEATTQRTARSGHAATAGPATSKVTNSGATSAPQAIILIRRTISSGGATHDSRFARPVGVQRGRGALRTAHGPAPGYSRRVASTRQARYNPAA